LLPLLSIQNLSVQFSNEGQKSTAVKNVSIEIAAGEMVAIVGESGSGKSVTALSLLQLLPKQASVEGRLLFTKNEITIDLLTLSASEINAIRGKDIAMIFQEPMTSLNPVFTCGSQVMEAIQLHQKISKPAAKVKTIALFEKVKLPHPAALIHRYPHELSGGQKQRVMIAMAMSCGPSLLIADEPTTALDVTVQKTILDLIKELQVQNKMSVLLITHDLGVVADVADKIVVMYQGEIVEQGKTPDILTCPKHNYTRALLACRPLANLKGKKLPVVADFLSSDSGGEGEEKLLTSASTNAENLNVLSKAIPPQTFLSVQNLKIYFPLRKNLFGKAADHFKAVDDVSFIVKQGETVGLVGESGCGKTTLGRAILQLIKPTEGKIILGDKDLSSIQPAALRILRKDLQIVFQDPYGSLNPRLSIGNAILEPLKVHGILENNFLRKQKVINLLEKVSLLPDHFNRYPHQFSGGQRQRICIARALALHPSFLIFDESVSALDVSVQAQVLNLLNDLKQEFGFTAIFISHDLSVVHYICDRILVMHKGKIIEEGNASELYYHPKNEYTKKLIDAIPGKKPVY
jgi:peptide/nickel transport system ATP-binding protein